jgi:hypothetical protein
MASLHFIGGEKGGVGKSVMARALAQHFIDTQQPFVGFDTDRSHTSFTRFYSDFASPVLVDSYEGLDQVVAAFDSEATPRPQVIVDMAAQTAAPLARWIADSDLLGLMASLEVPVYFWHLSDGGSDSVALLQRLLDSYGAQARYIVVKNWGRGSDFQALDTSPAMAQALGLGAQVLDLPALHEGSMRKIDRQNASFWAAIHTRPEADALGLLERQRVKTWLKKTYEALEKLQLGH